MQFKSLEIVLSNYNNSIKKHCFLFSRNKSNENINNGLIEVDIIRQDNLAYEYLCHLEETKV